MTLGYVCHKCGKHFSEACIEGRNQCSECGGYILKKYHSSKQELTILGLTPQFSKSHDLARVAEDLRHRTEQYREYEIIPQSSKLGASPNRISDSWIFGCELDDALRLKKNLQRKFQGKTIEDAFHGKVISNAQGEFYEICETQKIYFKQISSDESREKLLSNLCLLSGIGPAREHSLKQQGYKTIEDLLVHLKWKKSAAELLNLIDSKDVAALQNRLRRILPKSHPLGHYLAGFCSQKDLAVIDIETLGLFGRPIILVGLAKIGKHEILTSQFLARDVSEEGAILSELAGRLTPENAFVTYNGRCFDLPFIRERLAFYGQDLNGIFENPHFDMLHFARRALRRKLGSCRLESIENYLGIARSVNVPGALVPEFYDSYQRFGNVGPLVAIVEHNKQDLLTLSKLFFALYQEWD